jgi:hypothetical protein
MMDTWEGHKGSAEEGVLQKKSQLPSELNVTIFATFACNMKEAKLDINDNTLVFEYPNLYYLDLDLKYVVNPADGNAKFDKTKKTLNIKLPVIGSTLIHKKFSTEITRTTLPKRSNARNY